MTLLIALIANAIYQKMFGAVFIDNGWIVFIWILHLAYHNKSSSK